MIKKTKTAFLVLATVSSVPFLSGCVAASALNTVNRNIFQRDEINLTESNYAAADYLIQQGRHYIKKYDRDLIVVEPLTDQLEPRMSSELGKIIPEEIGIRLAQLGYRTDIEAVKTIDDPNYMRPAIKKGENPDFILTGNYLRGNEHLDVNLRIVKVSNGQIVSAFNYKIPMTYQIGELSMPQTQIFRISKGQRMPNVPVIAVEQDTPKIVPETGVNGVASGSNKFKPLMTKK